MVPKPELGLSISGVRRCGKTPLAIQVDSAFETFDIVLQF